MLKSLNSKIKLKDKDVYATFRAKNRLNKFMKVAYYIVHGNLVNRIFV